jgi:transcriptional regulator with XRE-family HTH domain
VPGLRREEAALLAGISIAYYTKLERNASGVSETVLEALARALQLDVGPANCRVQAFGRSSATAARSGAAGDGHASFDLAADQLLLALVELDLRLRCLVRRGDDADPLGLALGLASLALPLLMLVLRPAHAVPPFACARTR